MPRNDKSSSERSPRARLAAHVAVRRAMLAVVFRCVLGLACFYLPGVAAGQQAVYTNPVVAGDYPDPTVIRVGQDYWAMTTTGTWAPHFPILHSRDLVNWQTVGYVFEKRPAWVKSDFWAPELVEDKGRFFVYYVGRRNDGPKKPGTLCVAVATAPAPIGPYTDHGPLVCQIPELKNVGSIDPFFMRDEKGEPYLIWKADGNDAEPDQPTSIFIQRLTEDGTRLVGKRREILRNDAAWERHVTEGSYILKRGEWFYHFYSGNACCGRGCEYALGVARSHTLTGRWEKDPSNPILKANRDWQCPGHGSIVRTPDGRYFLLYHSYRRRSDTFSVGREALLDEVTWNADGWPTINAGAGPTSRAPSPLGVPETEDETEFEDDFKRPQLDMEWQWPMFNEQAARVDAGGDGALVLTPLASAPSLKGVSVDELTGAVLARRPTSGDYTATVRIDARGLSANARAGLSAYSWRRGATGVSVGGGKVFVWRREEREERTLASAEAPRAPSIYLRMTANGGETYRFAFSADGRNWQDLGGPVDGSYIEGARIALVAGGPAGIVARFDYVRITPARAAMGKQAGMEK